jgi:hypothetical protein
MFHVGVYREDGTAGRMNVKVSAWIKIRKGSVYLDGLAALAANRVLPTACPNSLHFQTMVSESTLRQHPRSMSDMGIYQQPVRL